MITAANLEELAARLRVYDVDQEAWEQEPHGFEANTRHVLTHLAKDLVGKSFEDEDTVRTAIAPDSVQYGLRLARWSGISVSELAELSSTEEDIRSGVEESLGHRKLPWGFGSFAAGMRTLALYLHDADHASTRENTIRGRQASMRSASRLLINSASIQSHQYGFSLPEEFDNRLVYLRKRFGIPQPQDS
jgi:hypothetical protein